MKKIYFSSPSRSEDIQGNKVCWSWRSLGLATLLLTFMGLFNWAQAQVLTVDLSTANQITITATGAASAADATGGTGIGFYFANFFGTGGSQSVSGTVVSGANLVPASVTTDGSPSLYRNGSNAGLNIWSYSATSTTTFTAGSQAFSGAATWTISAALYDFMVANAPSSDNVYFPADDDADLATAVLIGTYEVILPNPTVDNDGDGFTPDDGDCNDNDATIYPGATEIPDDGIDQDCDGEDASADNDGDGFTVADGDCNDSDPAIYPGAEEIPNDGIDQDCDGEDLIVLVPVSINCASPLSETYCSGNNDLVEWLYSNDGSGPLVISFTAGNVEDGWDILRIYDGTDNSGTLLLDTYNANPDGSRFDLTGTVLVATSGSIYMWFDSDSSVSCESSTDVYEWNYTISCEAPEDADGDGVFADDDCDDNDPEVGLPTTWYADADGDGFGDADVTMEACEQPEGYVDNSDDCDDSDDTIYPGAEEIANDGIDQDCDGSDLIIDEPLEPVIVECGTPLDLTYCTGNSQDVEWLYTSSTGEPLTISFTSGGIENSLYDDLIIYDGTNNDAEILWSNPASNSVLDGLELTATSGSLYITFNSDSSWSCEDGTSSGGWTYSEWVYSISCGTVEPVDTDGDGIPDDEDECPTEAGPAENGGCPVVVEDCPAPTGVGIDTTPTSVTAWCDENPAHVAYDLETTARPIRRAVFTGVPNWQDVPSPFTATGLAPNYDYSFMLRADCSGDDSNVSEWVGPFAFSTPSAARNAELANQVLISPNPAVSVVNVQSEENVQYSRVQIYSANGSLVADMNVTNNQFDVNALQTGRYMLQLFDANGNVTVEKLIKK